MKAHKLSQMFSFFFPHVCVLCNQRSKRQIDLCNACAKKLPWIQQGCMRCGRPILHETTVCGHCLKRPPLYEQTIALFRYEDPVSKLLIQLKFHQQLAYANLLGTLLAEKIMRAYSKTQKPDCIIPMPLHVNRLKERGFNQAVELARPVVQALKIPMDLHACMRIKSTQPQTLIAPNERKKNVKNAFQVNDLLKGKYVAILDDVMTSGETINALCKQLKAKQVRRIDVWCCARAGSSDFFF